MNRLEAVINAFVLVLIIRQIKTQAQCHLHAYTSALTIYTHKYTETNVHMQTNKYSL